MRVLDEKSRRACLLVALIRRGYINMSCKVSPRLDFVQPPIIATREMGHAVTAAAVRFWHLTNVSTTLPLMLVPPNCYLFVRTSKFR